jgi:PAS domain S-box-containing protein
LAINTLEVCVMEAKGQSRKQLLDELSELRLRLSELTKSENHYHNLIDNAHVGVYQTNHKGDILYMNNACLRMFGFENMEEAVTGGSFRRYQDQEDRKNNLKILKKTGRLTNFEVKLVTNKREPIVVLLSATLESDVITGMVVDITERKRSEEALRTSQLQLSEAMELAKIVYWEVDPTDGAFIFNDPFYAFCGTTAEQEGGYRMTRDEYLKRFVHPDDQSRVSQIVVQRITAPGPEFLPDLEHRIVSRNGEVRHILVGARAIKDGSGAIVKRYGVNQDVTDRKNAERELRTKSLLLEEVNTALKVLLEQREKDKTELEDKILFNVKKLILPYVDSLKQKQLDEDLRTYLDILETNLKNIVSPFAKKLTFIYENFTPLEIRVADFIRDGKTAKEIAKTFGVSESAVNLHRQHIRNKLGLNKQKINLRTYLLSLK